MRHDALVPAARRLATLTLHDYALFNFQFGEKPAQILFPLIQRRLAQVTCFHLLLVVARYDLVLCAYHVDVAVVVRS